MNTDDRCDMCGSSLIEQQAERAKVAQLIEALAAISLTEQDSSTPAVEKARDMARIARAALAAAGEKP